MRQMKMDWLKWSLTAVLCATLFLWWKSCNDVKVLAENELSLQVEQQGGPDPLLSGRNRTTPF